MNDTSIDKLTKAQKKALLREIENELCRRDFYKFCQFYDPVFFSEGKPHLKLIAEALQEVEEGKIKKLAISLPPRAGKSYILSLFCAWMLGKHPEGSIMRNSYAAKLAEKFSKDIRDGILTSPKYKGIFPNVKLSKHNTAVEAWSVEGNSQPSYFCAGVGGAITGLGASLCSILDDPLKNIEEALSETVMENVWNWYTSTHLSRFERGCPEIHVATRWSRRDPIGRLTDKDSAEYVEGFKTIVIPALNEEDKSFCDEIHTTEEYHAIRKVTDEFIWLAEYQQQPVESKGLLFPVEELKRFGMKEIATKTPDATVGVVDTADKGSDFLSAPFSRSFGESVYITDVVFTQDGVEITEPLVAQKIIDTKSDIVKIEGNNGGISYARNIRRLIKGKSPCMVIDEMNMTNKETRILMNAGYIKEHFYFRDDYEPGSDYDKFMRQLTNYIKLGNNKHDDAPDSVTMLAEHLKYKVYGGAKPPEKQWNFASERPKHEFGEPVELDSSYINYGSW